MTLLELFHLMRAHLKLVIIVPLVCALAAAAFSWTALPDEYTANVSLYVLSKNNSDTNSQSLTNSELNAGQMLSNDIASLMKSDRVRSAAAQSLGLSSLGSYDITITSSTTTRVITLSVTGTDPQDTANVANAIAASVDSIAQSVMDVKSVNIIDKAPTPTSPSGPKRSLYTAVALLAGLFLVIAYLVIRDALDTRVRTGAEVEELIGVPVIGRMPKIRA